MRIPLPAVLVVGLFALGACHSATVRGTEGRSLTATTPRSISIQRGDSAALEVGIDRENFTGPVIVTLFQLPTGVESDQSSIAAQTTSATFILTAADSADLVRNQAVGVTVEDPNGRRATQYVSLSVTD